MKKSSNREQAFHIYNEALTFQKKGMLIDAERLYRKAIKLHPSFLEALNNLGNVLKNENKLKEATGIYKKALKQSPHHPLLLNNIGNALQLRGENIKAIEFLQEALSVEPHYSEAHNNLANAFRELGRYDESLMSFQEAVKYSPDNPDILANAASFLAEKESKGQAELLYKQALNNDPNHVRSLIGLGKVLKNSRRLDRSIELFHQALKLEPENTTAFVALGDVLSDQGKTNEALSFYKKAIQIKPDMIDAYCGLFFNTKYSKYNSYIKSMESLYADKNLSREDRTMLCFSLGKAYEDLKKYKESIQLIIEANNLKSKSIDYSISKAENFVMSIISAFPKEYFDQRRNVGYNDKTPIFILGMPRSGTSLVEQILSSHPMIYGAGELTDIADLTKSICIDHSSNQFPLCINDVSNAKLKELGKAYASNLRRFSNECEYITDKMPHNFLYIGFIKTILPDAKIIHCIRDPMDNCLSLFKNYFEVSTHDYSYDMKTLGEYYNIYTRIMEYWQNIFHDEIYELSYEQLVYDQERETRKLLKYCNLPWDDSCLNFHKTKRTVSTASKEQVRRELYNDSVKLWKNYEVELSPLRKALYD